MNVLFVSAVLPYPLYSGGQIRIYQLLKRLSTNNKITLVSFIRKNEEINYIKELSFCSQVIPVYRGHAWQPSYILRALTSNLPFLLATYENTVMQKTLANLLTEHAFDLVHIEPGYVYPSIPKTSLPLVVSEHNIEHTVYQSYVKRFSFPLIKPFLSHDVSKLKQWEKRIWNEADARVTVSPSDAEYIYETVGKHAVVVPNGVDESAFTFHPKKIQENFTALFVGNFRWVQNRDAAGELLKKIWPTIIHTYPNARLELVGRDFPENLRSFLFPSVTLHEEVEDIREAFSRSHMLLAPIHIGGGTKYKVLEAMAAGVPVITTEKGREGLAARDGQEFLLATTLEDWQKAVTTLVTKPQVAKKITTQARTCIEKQYTWNEIAQELSDVWKTTYEKKRH